MINEHCAYYVIHLLWLSFIRQTAKWASKFLFPRINSNGYKAVSMVRGSQREKNIFKAKIGYYSNSIYKIEYYS